MQGCIELGLTIIPRGGGTGYTGGAVPLTWKSAVINTEKLDAMSEVEMRRLPGVEREVATIWTEAGVVTQRVADAAERAGFVFAVDPTSAEAVVHRRQRRDERRRQEGGAVGHRARQPRVVAHGHAARRSGSKSCAWTTTSARSTTSRRRASSCATTTPTARRSSAPSVSTSPGATFRKEGLGKDVTDKFLAGLPGIQKEGCDGLITSARWIVHRMPAHVRTVCLEFFGNPKDAVPSIVEIKDYLFSLNRGVTQTEDGRRRCCWPGSSIWTTAI